MSDVSSKDFLSHPSFHLLLSFPLLEHSFSCMSLAVELGTPGGEHLKTPAVQPLILETS